MGITGGVERTGRAIVSRILICVFASLKTINRRGEKRKGTQQEDSGLQLAVVCLMELDDRDFQNFWPRLLLHNPP